MSGHTVILSSPDQRVLAKRIIDAAPDYGVVNVKGPKRTIPQNDKMWAMLTDISLAKPEGHRHTPEVWKALFMHALGFEQRFLTGLNGEPFPAGFRSSQLNKAQMADLITFIQEYGDRHGIAWREGESA
ncbi:MAG: recombination protein NinB [Pseudomonadota bacterium]